MAITGTGFAISLGYYTAAAAICYILFGFFRKHKLVFKYYAPKCFFPKGFIKFPPPTLPKVFFGWIIPVLSYDQKQVLEYAGLDGLTMLRLLYLGLGYSLFATFFCCSVLIPVNITTGDTVNVLIAEQQSANRTVTYSDLDKIGLANIDPRSNVLWVHVVITYLLSFFMYGLLWRYHKEAVALRINYLANVEKGAESNTVLLRDIPAIPGGTPIERFSTTFLFFVPEKHRRSATLAFANFFTGLASSASRLSESCGNALFDCGLGTLLWFHNCKKCCGKTPEPLPVTRRSSATSAAEIPPEDQKMSENGGKADLLGLDAPQVTVKGIPISTELSATPRAERMVTSGMGAQQMVDNECTELFRDEFVSAQLVYDTTELEPRVGEYEKRVQSMMDTCDALAAKARNGKLLKKNGSLIAAPKTFVIGSKYGEWGMSKYGKGLKKVETIDFNIGRLEQLKLEIQEHQTKAVEKPAPAAFVTFRSRVSQTLISSAMIHHDTSAWTTGAAPSPNDVVWPNLRWRAWERSLRKALIFCATIALVLLYMIPVTFVQGIISSANWLGPVNDIAALNAIYQAVVPQLALKIFLLLLPPILKWWSRLEGRVSITDVQMGLEVKFFYFQYFAVYLTTIIASSLLSQIKTIINDVGSIVTILGTSVPQAGTFFTTLIMLEALFGHSFGLLKVVGMAIYWVKEKMAMAARAKDRCWQEQYAEYGDNVGTMMLSFLIIVSYSPVFPLIAPFGIVWFTTAIIQWKYQLVYMYRPEVESGGQLWPQVYRQILVATWTMQLLVTVVIAIKKNVAAAIVMAISLAITPAFGIIANSRFARPLQIQSLRCAVDLDKRDGMADESTEPMVGNNMQASDVEGGCPRDLYKNPVFGFDEEQHKGIIAELTRWNEIFGGAPWTPEEFATTEDVVATVDLTVGDGKKGGTLTESVQIDEEKPKVEMTS